MGKDIKGAQRWIDLGPLQFQPSELTKLLIVLTLSTFFAMRSAEIRRFSTFALSFAHIALPLALVLAQPHLGAALVLVVTWLAISIVAGVPAKYIGATMVLGTVCAGMALTVPAIQAKLLHGYQQKRIEGVMSRGQDTRGKNYQTDRAEIAFGVGGVLGSGFLRGEQKDKHFIPEQHSDFIFTVVGEEGGLVGSSLVLLCFGFFYYRVFLVMIHATEPFYRMIAGGIFTVLVFHTFVNIGMVLQLLPVVGLWLPFLSYGGTAMWLCMASVGLLLAIRRHEKPLLF
jgi:rod shape determining protein RodA